jgi:uncharacterized protein
VVADGPPFRLLPRLDAGNRFFWTSGADGRLRFLCCGTCRHLVHPPVPRCPLCLGDALAPTAVSGRATVVTYTVNHQQWVPGAEPYIIALVAMVEQDDIRLTTNLVGADPAEVRSGMPVEVVFEAVEDVFLPLFRPGAPR